MQPNHLIMKLFDPHLLIKSKPISNTQSLLLPAILPHPLFRIIKIYITIFDEILPKLTHTLSILRLT